MSGRFKPAECAACRYGGLKDRRWCGSEVVNGASAWVIAENPGETEAENGRPLHPDGASGREVRRALADAGLAGKVSIGNVRCCRLPRKEEKGAFAESAAHCMRHYLVPELMETEPKRLVLLGGKALRAFMGLGEGTPYRETVYHGSMWRRAEIDSIRAEFREAVIAPLPESVEVITASLHPSFAIRGKPSLKPLIREVIARGLRPLSDTHTRVKVAVGEREIIAFIERSKVMGLDVETTLDGRIEIVGVSDGKQTLVSSATLNINAAIVMRLADPTWTVIGHNVGFDLLCYMKLGADVRCVVIDTMDEASIAHPGVADMPWHGLQTCALRYVEGISAWKPRRYEVKGEHRVDWRYAHAVYRALRPDVPTFLYEQLYCGLDTQRAVEMAMGVAK